MAVLIEGMEMPKGELGAIPIMIYANGNVEYFFSHEKYGKVIEVPEPHGDLIDASEKIRVQMYDDEYEDFHTVEMTIDDLLGQGWVEADAPTVIPASKEAE